MNRRVRRRAIWYGAIAWLVLSGLLAGSSPSSGATTPTPIPGAVFGPEDFIRQRGRPSAITGTFSVAHPSGAATLCIVNGGLRSHGDWRPHHFFVASAEVVLNKVKVLQPRDFTPHARHVARPVTLHGTNTLTVTLHSQPGSGLTLWIVQGSQCAGNTPPVADAGPAQTVPVATLVQLDGSRSSDADGDRLTYRWSFVSMPVGSAATPSDPTAVRPTFHVDLPGRYVAQLVVNDGTVDSEPATVAVSTENSRPTANAGQDRTVPLGTLVTLDGRQSSDPDGDALGYRWQLLAEPDGSTAMLVDATTATPRFLVDVPGSYLVQLIVNDGGLDSPPDTVVITTENSRPVASAGPDQTVILGQTVELDGRGSSDADHDPLSYRWSFTSVPEHSTVSLAAPTATQPTFVPDVAGLYVVQLIVNDGHEDSAPSIVRITVTTPPPANHPPVADAGPAQTVDVGATVQLDGRQSSDPDGDALTFTWDLNVKPAGSTATLSGADTAQASFVADLAGTYLARLTVDDGRGGTANAPVTITARPPNQPPVANAGPAQTVTVGVTVNLDGSQSSDPDADPLTFRWTLTSRPATSAAALGNATTATPSFVADVAGDYVAQLIVNDGTLDSPAATVTVTATTSGGGGGLPPDPATIAPPVSRGVATSLGTAVGFLYSGSNPIQTGVDPAVIDPRRLAVVRGRVLDGSNHPLPGVTITISSHPELGQTLSRADGMFDMVVNGGGLLLVNYAKAGFLPAQRQIRVPWQDFARLPDVVLLPVDARVSVIDLAASQAMQVARGSAMTDNDGTRQATLLFPSGTGATMVFPGGATQSLTRLSVRATEYTVGPNGPKAMAAELPPNSGYTYAVEFSVDEAKAAGAIDVRFSSPLPFYVENFLGFPVGTGVPLGSYNRERGAWVAQDNGRVLKILSVANGMADLDTTGDGTVDNGAALGITEGERRQLATLYTPGQSLWRVLIPHFDDVWDANWGIKPPDTATEPDLDPNKFTDRDCVSQTAGSVIECPNQILGEVLGVVGTPFELNYGSERVPGRNIAYKIEIPLSGPQLPDKLKRIELEVSVAGQLHAQTFPAAPDQRTTFTWNGENAYGQVLQGQQPITVRIGYTYPAEYGFTNRFGHDAGDAITGSRTRMEITLWRSWRDLVGAFDERGIGLGGWTLSPHHTYVPQGKVVYRGDGGRQTARTMPPTISTYAGTGTCGGPIDGVPATGTPVCPEGLAFGPDGSLYIASPAVNVVRRVAPNGIITTVAGNTNICSSDACGDGGPATQAQLRAPFALAVGPDNSLYISQVGSGQLKVRRVSPDGIITTFAGTGAAGFSGDGGPAQLAQFTTITSLAMGPDGSLYLADQSNLRVRRVTPDGIVDTVAGTGSGDFSGDGGPAVRAGLAGPRGIAVGQDGSLYIADSVRVRRVTPDGIIRTIAGNGQNTFSGDGGPATQAGFGTLTAVAVGADDSVYVADTDHFRLRWMRPGGTINTLAGTGVRGTSGDGGPARQAKLQDLNFGLAVGPDGAVYVSQDANNTRVRRIAPVPDTLLIPSLDGDEVYLFSESGQHLQTIDALTAVVRYRFAYDGAGRLVSITDRNGEVTLIEHDGGGNPTAIIGSFGKRTILAVNADGYLDRVTSPGDSVAQAAYTRTGLLTSFTNPRGQTTSYAFDADGFLTSATDPTGATKTLARSGTNNDYTVTLTTALGRTTTYRVEQFDNGDVRQTVTDPAGAQSVAFIGSDGMNTVTLADGTTVKTVLAPDPRWGMLAPITASGIVTTPGGRVRTAIAQRAVTLGAVNDPLSLRTQTDTLSVNGRASITTFDAPSRTLTTTSPAGRRSTMVLDDRARPVQRQFGDLEATALTYDSRGRLATMTQGGRITTFTYDGDGFLTSLTDASGRTLAFTKDADGRVTQETLPDGRVVRFAYDLNGNLTTLTPPGRSDYTFSYTLRDQFATSIAPAVGAEIDEDQYSYDTDRQPLRATRADGQAVQFQYDTAGRLSLMGLVSGDRGYSYDAANRVTSLTTPPLSMTYTYDGALPTASAWTGAITGGVARTFDNDFRVTSHSVDGANLVTIQYDADSLITQVGALSLTRSPQTGFITATALGALTDSRRFDTFGDLVQYSASQSGSVVYALDVTRDALRRITSKTETVGGATHVFSYVYDVAGRLTEVRQDGLLTETYTFDANDNRVTGPQATVAYAYDAQDRLAQRSGLGTQDYSSTPNGERQSTSVAGQTTTYRYDSLGHLSGVSLPNGTQIDYVLDGIGRRAGKRINGVLVQAFLYQDGLRPIAELGGAGTVVSRFVYAERDNVPDYLVKGSATYRIIKDQLGSPRLVIDTATGSVAQQLDYDTFGNVLVDTNPGFQPFGFAGGLYDSDTKLTRYGLRDYDPETGRWTTKDPGGFSGGPNLYAYANNDPVNFVDSLGDSPYRKVPPDQPAPPMNPNPPQYPSSPAPRPTGPTPSEAVLNDFERMLELNRSPRPSPGPDFRLPPGGGTALEEEATPLLEVLSAGRFGRVCRVVAKPLGTIGVAVQIGYWSYLAANGEWKQLGLNVIASTTVGDVVLTDLSVIQQASKGDIAGAGWTYVKTAVPIVGIGAWLGDHLNPF
jgi:RHS repeat-associated protein